MAKRPLSDSRLNAFILVLIVLLTALGLVLYNGYRLCQVAGTEAGQSALRIARQTSVIYDHLVTAAQQMLVGLAQSDPIRNHDPQICAGLLSGVRKKFPQYSRLEVTDDQGRVFCSDGPSSGPDNPVEPSWIPEVRVTITDVQGRPSGAITAFIDPNALTGQIDKIGLPSQASVSLIDTRGALLVNTPGDGHTLRGSTIDAQVLRQIQSQKEGSFEDKWLLGTPSVIGFTRLGSAQEISAAVGMATAAVFAEANRELATTLVWLAVVAMLAVSAAWIGAYRIFMRHTRDLVVAVRRLTAGDLGARVGNMQVSHELGELGAAFDELGEALQSQKVETEAALEALKMSEAKFRALTETSASAIFIVQDGIFRYASPAWVKITGFSEEELLGMRFEDIVHPQAREELITRGRAVLSGDETSPRYEFKIITKSGEERWIEFAGARTQNEGNPAMLGSALDITDQMQSRDALIASEERFRRLVDRSPDAIYIISDGKLMFINPAGVRLFGARSAQDLLGRSIFDYLHPDFLDIVRQRIRSIGAGMEPPSIEEKIIRMDGACVDIEVTSTAFTYEGKPSIQIIARDITERKRTEETRRQHALEMEALYQTSLEINAQLDLHKLLQAIVERAANLIGASKGGVYLTNPNGNTLELVIAYNIPGVVPGTIVPIGDGVSGKAALTGHYVEVSNYETWEGRIPLYANVSFGRVLGVPLKIENRVIGVISITDNERTGAFSEDEIRIVTLFADQAAIAVERTRLYQAVQQQLTERERYQQVQNRMVDELSALHAVALAGNEAANLDELVERVTLIIGEKLFPDDFGLGFVDETRGGLSFHKSYRIRQGVIIPHITLGEGITGWVAKYGRPRRVADVLADPDYRSADPSIRSELCVPIMLGERVLGIVNAENTQPDAFSETDERLLVALAGELGTAIEKIRLLDAERRRREEAETLRDLTASLTSTLDLDQVLKSILTYLERVVPYDSTAVMLLAGDHLEITAQRGFHSETQRKAILSSGKQLHIQEVLERVRPVIIPDTSQDERWHALADSSYIHCWLGVPLVVMDRVIGLINLDKQEPQFYTQEDADLALAFANQAAIAIENARLFEAERQRSQELAELANVSAALRLAQNRATIIPMILDQVMGLIECRGAALLMVDPETQELYVELGQGVWQDRTGNRIEAEKNPFLYRVIETGQVYESSSFADDPELANLSWLANLQAFVCVPLMAQDQPVGILCLGKETALPEGELRLLNAIAEISANAIHRTTLHDQTVSQLQRMSILRAVDMAITASFDAKFTLNVLVEETVTGLKLDAVDVLRFNPVSHSLEVTAVKGIRNPALSHPRGSLKVISSLDRRLPQTVALMERRPVIVPDLTQVPDERARLLVQEGFVCAVIAPFIAKGQVKGLMEIFFRSPFKPNRDWMDFIESLAGQAAIALDNVELFENLEHSNLELSLAYDATIEGWSQALDLRDKETEGHTRRVTEKTNELAQMMGLAGAQLTHMRRGALLHDIGKLGVPDSVLLKPGPLDDEEWAVMRRHPVLAYEMLSSIAFLRPAIDIPYCHHEKWDGTGYPRGLKGEEIPLAARVFAVVDVWEALSSDRCYRKAWAENEVRQYIREQSGIYFDPEIVAAFFRLMDWDL